MHVERQDQRMPRVWHDDLQSDLRCKIITLP
jgi:hypothetical protein